MYTKYSTNGTKYLKTKKATTTKQKEHENCTNKFTKKNSPKIITRIKCTHTCMKTLNVKQTILCNVRHHLSPQQQNNE